MMHMVFCSWEEVLGPSKIYMLFFSHVASGSNDAYVILN